MIYRLLRDDGGIECEGDARDGDHALVVLGGLLGKTLAFDGPVGPAYVLHRAKANEAAQWRPRQGRGVYVIDDKRPTPRFDDAAIERALRNLPSRKDRE